MRKYLFLVSAAFILVAGQNITAQPRKADSQPHKQQAESQPSPTPTNASPSAFEEAAKTESERYRKERDVKEDSFKAEQLKQNQVVTWATVIIAIATVFNLGVAVVYVVLSNSQLREIKKQAGHAEEQAEAMQGQLVAMKEQSAGIEHSVESATLNSIYANRAYVIAKIKDTGPYDEGFQFRLIIENGGNTPANNVCVNYWCDFGEPPWRMLPVEESPPNAPIKQVIFETTKAGAIERLGVIGPKASQVFTTMPPILVDMSVGTEECERWDSGQARFYCWGTIIYEDMFNKARQSHFCFCLWRKTADGYVSYEQMETGFPCEHGNYVT